MAPPVYSVGQVLGAADCNNWFLPLPAYKTSTQSVTSSITPVNDTQLSVSVAANAKYEFTCSLRYDGNSSGAGAGGIRAAFTVPASATVSQSDTSYKNDISAVIMYDGTLLAGSFGAGTTVPAIINGILTTSSTSGTFQLQWAQFGSSTTATRVFADSYLSLTRVG